MKNNLIYPAISIIGSALISAAVSYGFQSYGDSVQHDRAARLQIALDFTSTEDNLIPIATRYMHTVANGDSISAIQAELRSYLATEIARADHLKSEFQSSVAAIRDYQDALQALAQAIEQATNPTQMTAWVEAFGRVVDARQHLQARLNEAARA